MWVSVKKTSDVFKKGDVVPVFYIDVEKIYSPVKIRSLVKTRIDPKKAELMDIDDEEEMEEKEDRKVEKLTKGSDCVTVVWFLTVSNKDKGFVWLDSNEVRYFR